MQCKASQKSRYGVKILGYVLKNLEKLGTFLWVEKAWKFTIFEKKSGKFEISEKKSEKLNFSEKFKKYFSYFKSRDLKLQCQENLTLLFKNTAKSISTSNAFFLPTPFQFFLLIRDFYCQLHFHRIFLQFCKII